MENEKGIMSMGSEASVAGDSGESQAQTSLERVIQEFLCQHDYLHEFRVQKLVYLADLVAYLKDEQRLTDADFKPYMYGSYSEDIRNTLNELEDSLPTEADLQHGKVTTKFNGGPENVDNEVSGEEIAEIIEEVREATKGWTSEDLGEWSKDSWLYQHTDYDSEMDFSDLDPVSDRVESELLETFPSLKDVLTNKS